LARSLEVLPILSESSLQENSLLYARAAKANRTPTI
jgi:hypothetical protein